MLALLINRMQTSINDLGANMIYNFFSPSFYTHSCRNLSHNISDLHRHGRVCRGEVFIIHIVEAIIFKPKSSSVLRSISVKCKMGLPCG